MLESVLYSGFIRRRRQCMNPTCMRQFKTLEFSEIVCGDRGAWKALRTIVRID